MCYKCKKKKNLSNNQSRWVKLENDAVIQIMNMMLTVNGRLLLLMMQAKL